MVKEKGFVDNLRRSSIVVTFIRLIELFLLLVCPILKILDEEECRFSKSVTDIGPCDSAIIFVIGIIIVLIALISFLGKPVKKGLIIPFEVFNFLWPIWLVRLIIAHLSTKDESDSTAKTILQIGGLVLAILAHLYCLLIIHKWFSSDLLEVGGVGNDEDYDEDEEEEEEDEDEEDEEDESDEEG